MKRFFSDLINRFIFRQNEKATDKFLDKWSGQSIDEIVEMRSQYRVDSLILALEQAIQLKESNGAPLTEPETLLLSIEALEREVNNGGFAQFFENDSNRYVSRVSKDLSTIGCNEASKIVSGAIRCLKLTDLSSESVRQRLDKSDQKLSEKLDDADEAFFCYPDDIAFQLFEFVIANKSEFKI